VIAEVYGGGGNSGATWTNDFVELGNRATAAVDLTGWSVQYLPANSQWQVTPLTGSLQAGRHDAGAGRPVPGPRGAVDLARPHRPREPGVRRLPQAAQATVVRAFVDQLRRTDFLASAVLLGDINDFRSRRRSRP
jgi:predicted extracellular nuclease